MAEITDRIDALGEERADLLGVYGVHPIEGDIYYTHPLRCTCRICFTSEVGIALEKIVSRWEQLKLDEKAS